jgi:NADH-quinone oxidoreductase subunit L
MSGGTPLLHGAVLVMVVAPASLLVALAIPSLLRRPLRESVTADMTRLAMLAAFAAALVAVAAYLAAGAGPQLLSYGAWFALGAGRFAFDFVVDGRSLAFAVLSTGICGVVAAFSRRYLHLEPGFNRYFVQFAMFVLGITLVALAGSIEVLFAGWELLGLSSALLVGFFHERRAPVVNALRVFAVYRVSDAAMLGAAVLLHHWAGSGSLALLFSGQSGSEFALHGNQPAAIALLLIGAVAGKSALLPFSGWLPRAMEGPTPSSAVYYGALSIHAGCLLLLRAEPLLAQSPTARVIAAVLGAATALYATLTARVQTDVKSALAYAALTQVGIIVVEIALGLTGIALVHMLGHACFRVLQFLSAPNVLHDLHELENLMGGHVGPADRGAPAVRPAHRSTALYVAALERGFVDAVIDRFVVAPFYNVVGWLDRLDRLLSGGGAADDPACDGEDTP